MHHKNARHTRVVACKMHNGGATEPFVVAHVHTLCSYMCVWVVVEGHVGMHVRQRML